MLRKDFYPIHYQIASTKSNQDKIKNNPEYFNNKNDSDIIKQDPHLGSNTSNKHRLATPKK